MGSLCVDHASTAKSIIGRWGYIHYTGEVYVDVEYSSVSSTELSTLTLICSGFAISGPSSGVQAPTPQNWGLNK